jgi:hypothetical protein
MAFLPSCFWTDKSTNIYWVCISHAMPPLENLVSKMMFYMLFYISDLYIEFRSL